MVKLPKEMQKKRKPVQNNLVQLKKSVLQAFRSEYIKTKKRFKEGRRVVFKKTGEKSVITESPRDMGGYIHIFYGKNIIEVFIDHDKIEGDFFSRPDFRQRVNDFKQQFKHIAHHEFGHSFLTKTNTDLDPKEVKEYLKQIGVEKSQEVPEELEEKYFEVYKNSEIYQAVITLQNVDITSLYNEFKEFHAYYMVKKKGISETIPMEFLQWNYRVMSSSIKNFRSKKEGFLSFISEQEHMQVLPHDPFFALYSDGMSVIYDFFIYGEWDRLISLFKKHDMVYFLYFMHTINEIYKTIADNYTDIDTIQGLIIQLSKIMDNVNYEGLIFDNQFDEQIQQQLNEFKQGLGVKN